MTLVGKDVVSALRRLVSAPLFTIFAIASLAVGIGAMTAIYSIIHTVLSPPPGIQNVDEVVNIAHWPEGSVPITGVSLPDFEDYRARQTVLAHVSAWGQMRQMVSGNGQTYTSFGEIVTGEYFALLGVQAAAGRVLQPADDRPGAPPAVVLSYRAWQQLFGGRDDAVGASVKVNGQPFTVVGIAPREFRGQFNNGLIPSAAWLPMAYASLFSELGGSGLRERANRWLRVQGRLPPGTPMSRVRTEVAAIAGQIDLSDPLRDPSPSGQSSGRKYYANSRQWVVTPLPDVYINQGMGPFARLIRVAILGALGLVLLIACSNLANLVLARALARSHEWAVRRALGASWWRLAIIAAAEAIAIGLAGGLAGLGLARVLVMTLETEFDVTSGAKFLLYPRIDVSAFLVCLGATTLAVCVAGIAPAWVATRASVRGALAADNAQSAGPRWRGRRLLIAGQVAASVTLLAVAALFLGQLRAAARMDSGIDLERLAVAEVDFAAQRVPEADTRSIVAAVVDRLKTLRVESVAVSSGLPVGLYTPGSAVSTPGGPLASAQLMASTPEIFATLGVPIVRGRPFDVRDQTGTESVVVINETTARTLFGETAPIGQQISVRRRQWVGEEPQPARLCRVIGVARDTDSGSVGRRSEGVIYVPWAQQYEGRVVFSVRVPGDPAAVASDLRKTIAAVAPDIGIGQVGSGLAVAGPPVLFPQVVMAVSGALGGFGLLLAFAGLAGVLTQIVSRRTREIGVRLALGASPAQVQRLILREGLQPVLLGLAMGGTIAFLSAVWLRFFGLAIGQSVDIAALAAIPVLLLVTGVIASALPARRAAHVDPNVALRNL